jgi:hypothetical protein
MPFLVGGNGVSVPIDRDLGGTHRFEQGPDGNEFFAILGPSINLVAAIRDMLEAQRIYLSYPAGKGRDQAAAVGVIIKELETAVHLSGVSTAQYAEDKAKSLLEKRLVRPATPGPGHLRDGIKALPLTVRGQPGSWGAVGVGPIALLDRYPYWKAQEFGSTHMVGAELHGYFFHPGGPSRAGAEPSRSQAVFGVTGTKGPKMLVQNPIQGKGFLTEATIEAMAYRYGIWRGVENAAVAQMRRVRVATAGDLAGKRYSGTVGGFARLARYRPPT